MTPKTTTATEIRFSNVDELREHGEDLIRAYATEIEPDLAQDLDPDWRIYYALEEEGRLIVLAAWALAEPESPARRLVGFAMVYLSPRPEYKGSLYAYHQALYVEPEHRGSRLATRMIDELRVAATDRGATELHMHAPSGTKFERLLPRIGFRKCATVFRVELMRS